MIARELRAKVGDLRQFASVRRITLDDGVEHGVRALAFSSGGGLDFWVLSDRSLDIGPLWWRGIPLAWQSMAGFRSPALHHAEEDGGRGYGRSSSGFLVTCGLDHIRQPIEGHPLHGRLPFTPARVIAHGEDWERDEPVLFCEGEVMQFRFGGEALRLRRRIEVPIGGSEIRIRDMVENLGAGETPQASLYHFNLGYPAIAPGSIVRLGSKQLLGLAALPDASDQPESISYPAGDNTSAVCTVSTPAVADHKGVADNQSAADSNGAAGNAGALGEGLMIAFTFCTDTLPYLQLWHDFRKHACVLGIEPCTSARADGVEKIMQPAESRRYEVKVRFKSGQ
jgi:hypothetical protein